MSRWKRPHLPRLWRGNLRKLIATIDALHWFSEERDAFGDAYEGLLQKMAEETKRGAGQYFTPRVLIKVMTELMQPSPGEVIQDPAAGTSGFLIAANQYIKAPTDDYFELSPKQQAFQIKEALQGVENVPELTTLGQVTPSDAPIIYGILQPGPEVIDGVPYAGSCWLLQCVS